MSLKGRVWEVTLLGILSMFLNSWPTDVFIYGPDRNADVSMVCVQDGQPQLAIH